MTAERHPEAAPMQHKLLKCSEVAALLRLSKMTVYRMVQDGELDGVRIGHNLRISRASVARVMGDLWKEDE